MAPAVLSTSRLSRVRTTSTVRPFWFVQNEKFAANKWENNRAGIDRGPFKQNQYGVAVGGPAVKDKFFWFGDYQGTKIRTAGGAVPGLGNTFTRTIPKPAFKNGDFSSLLDGTTVTNNFGRTALMGGIYDPLTEMVGSNGDRIRQQFAGNMIPMSRFDPASSQLINQFPNPNQNLGDIIPSNNYIVQTPGQQDNEQFDIRMDFLATEKDTLFGSFSYSDEDKFQAPPLPGLLDGGGFAGQTEGTTSKNFMVSWTRVWSPTVITETRVAWTRLDTARTQANADVDAFSQLGIGGLNPLNAADLNGGLMNLGADGYSGFGGSNWLPTQERSEVWDFIQNVSVNRGGHAFKFGFEFSAHRFPVLPGSFSLAVR